MSQKQDDLSGIRQELEQIRGEIDGLRTPPQFLGVEPGQGGDTLPEEELLPFEARLRKARDTGDILGALRIKQEAAGAGIVLL